MPSYIPPDFTPSPDTINRLRKKGIFPDFLENCVDDAFSLYWNEQKQKKLASGIKGSWDSTYFNWAVRASQGKVGIEWEKTRHRRESHGRGFKNDFFGEVLDRLDPTPKIVPTTTDTAPVYHKPRPRQVAPGGPPMTAEAAFEELRKLKII